MPTNIRDFDEQSTFADGGVWSAPEPTGRLRWRRGILEQAWASVQTNDDGCVILLRTTWEPVPTLSEEG